MMFNTQLDHAHIVRALNLEYLSTHIFYHQQQATRATLCSIVSSVQSVSRVQKSMCSTYSIILSTIRGARITRYILAHAHLTVKIFCDSKSQKSIKILMKNSCVLGRLNITERRKQHAIGCTRFCFAIDIKLGLYYQRIIPPPSPCCRYQP